MERTIRNRPHSWGTFVGGLQACTAAAVCLGWQPAVAADAPLAAFGHLPTLEDVAISPDGTKLAFVRTGGDSRKLVVIALNKSEALGAVLVGDTKLRDVEWVDDDNILATVSSTSPPPFGFTGATREWYQLVNFDVGKQKLHNQFFEVNDVETFNVVTGDSAIRDVSGHPTLYSRGYCVREGTVPCLFSVTYPDRRVHLLDEGREPDTEWLLNEAGGLAAQFVYHDAKNVWEIKTRQNGHWGVVASGTAAIDKPNMLGFSADGKGIIVRFVENGDPLWRALNLSDNSWGAPLAKGAAFSRTIEERKTGRIIGGIREIGSNEYVFFDNELQAHWNAVMRAFPDERVELKSHSDDFTRLVLKIFGAKDGYVYALFDWYTVCIVARCRSPGYPTCVAFADGRSITRWVGRSATGTGLWARPTRRIRHSWLFPPSSMSPP